MQQTISKTTAKMRNYLLSWLCEGSYDWLDNFCSYPLPKSGLSLYDHDVIFNYRERVIKEILKNI